MGCDTSKSNTELEEEEKEMEKEIEEVKKEDSDHNEGFSEYIAPSPRKRKSLDKYSPSRQDKFNDIGITPSKFIFERETKIHEDYIVHGDIGKGAYGKVKKCVHKVSKEVRAVKIIKKEYYSESTRERFFSEIQILKKLDHPNILKLYELYQDSANYYLITEFLEGGELFDRITKQKHFSEADAAHYMTQLLSAINYCHSNKIVHRDLKPENLLLDSDKPFANLKVIDFGTSQVYDKDKKMSQKFGTPYYIAPEVLNKCYDEKCDVWSCGVILFILLCGLPPFNGKTDTEIMNAVKKGTYHFSGLIWLNVSSEAKDLVKKLLCFNSENRLTASEALNHPWIVSKSEKKNVKLPSDLFDNLSNFRAEHLLQEASLMFIVSQLASKEDKVELDKIFKKMDINNDGKLSKEELINGYGELYPEEDRESVQERVEQLMKAIDIDKNGFIDYSEFIMAAINKKKFLSKDKLMHAFKMFDIDKSGAISSEELKQILGRNGKNIPDDVWEDLIKEIDTNGDGEITFDEFEKMMNRLLESNIIANIHD